MLRAFAFGTGQFEFYLQLTTKPQVTIKCSSDICTVSEATDCFHILITTSHYNEEKSLLFLSHRCERKILRLTSRIHKIQRARFFSPSNYTADFQCNNTHFLPLSLGRLNKSVSIKHFEVLI